MMVINVCGSDENLPVPYEFFMAHPNTWALICGVIRVD